MISLYAGITLFAGVHLYSMLAPAARAELVQNMGEQRYKGLYSLIALVGLILLGWSYWQGRQSGELLYTPWAGVRHLTMLLVLVGFIFIFSNQSKGFIAKTVKQPFSIGIALWSIGHLLANGETVVVWIFSMFLGLAILDIILSTARGKVPVHDHKWSHDVRGIGVGLVLYLVFAFLFHPYVLGIPVSG